MSLEAHLATFLAVCAAQGFGRAARRLGISQPSVSYRIRQLEAALGTTVVERGTGQFQLTPAGRKLAQLGARFTGEIRGLATQVAEADPGLDGPLRIAAVSGFGRYVLFPVVAAVRPPRLECYYRTAEQVFTLLRNGAVDLGFVYARVPSRALRFRPVYREELVLITPKGRPWSSVDWMARGAESVPFVTYEEHDYVFGKWFGAVVRKQPRHLSVAAHFDELEETINAVAAGWGASIVPGDAARKFGGSRIRMARPASGRCFNEVYLVQPQRPPQATVVRAAEAIVSALAAQSTVRTARSRAAPRS